MLRLEEAYQIINGSYTIPSYITQKIRRWEDVYYGMSLHMAGVTPRYQSTSPLAKNGYIYPPGYCSERHQALFDNYLLNAHPYENEMTRNWRYSQYKPLTKAPFQQCLQVITGAIFQDSNYTIDLDNRDDNEYIWGNNFHGKNIAAYFAWALQYICEDPNGYFVTLPKEPRYNTTTKKVEPNIWFVKSKDIIWHTEDDFIFLYEHTKWHLNKVGIFRYKETEPENGVWEPHPEDKIHGGYFAHMFDRLPIDVAGGIWNTMGYYDSWFVAAKALADDFIMPKSSSQLVDKEASHPFIISSNDECTECNHLGSIQNDCDCHGTDANCKICNGEGLRLDKCHKCKGTGYISHNPGQWINAPAEQMSVDLLKIVNPSVDINKLHHEHVKDLYKAFLEALFLYRTDKAESGTAKAIDQEGKYMFVSSISNALFQRLIPNQTKNIIAYRNVTTRSDGATVPNTYNPTIAAPSSFQIKTAEQLLEEYELANKANLPVYARNKIAIELTDKQFGGDAIMKRKAELITQMDALSTTTEADKAVQKNNGIIDVKDWRFSVYLPQILDRILREHGEEYFVSTEYDVIKAEADKLFAEMPVPTAPVTTNINESKTLV